MKRSSCFLLFIFLICSVVGFAQSGDIAIVNAKVYTDPVAKPLERGTILISKGVIQKVGATESVVVPKGFEIINGKDMVVTAGFWNCHVHLIEPKWQQAAAQTKGELEQKLSAMLSSYGITYAFDLAAFDAENVRAISSRLRSGEVRGPTLYYVGVPFTSKSPFYIKTNGTA